jgi:hypothetical protein
MYVRAYEQLGQPPQSRQPDFVRIILIDPAGIFKNDHKLREEIRSKLEDKFNNLDPNWLKQANIRFQAQYISNESSDEEKARFGKLDFPVYLLDRRHNHRVILKLMAEHKIPNTVKGRDYYDLAKRCWEERDTRGCGIPSGEGYRKVGFIKTHQVSVGATGDLWRAFVNMIAHEIGHMGNRLQHSAQGLMKNPTPLHVDIDFENSDKRLFLSDLQRLRLLKPKVQGFRWVFR